MRITFMGTPDFAVPSLELLARDHEVTLVVTRPDAVRGRGRELVPSPVKVRTSRPTVHFFNRSFWATPKRCSSSIISKPKSLNFTSLPAN